MSLAWAKIHDMNYARRVSNKIARMTFRDPQDFNLLTDDISRFASLTPAACVSRYSRSLAVSISQRPLASHERMLQQICDGIYQRNIPGRASTRLTARVMKLVLE